MKTDGINTDALLNNAANTTVWHTIRMTTLSVHYKEADQRHLTDSMATCDGCCVTISAEMDWMATIVDDC